jgi:hypothetical protein
MPALKGEILPFCVMDEEASKEFGSSAFISTLLCLLKSIILDLGYFIIKK